MSDAIHCEGRFLKRTLPALAPDPGRELPVLKRLMLPQGELAQCHDAEPAMRYIAAVELTPGSVRGNHYHREKLEHLYVIRGEVQLVLKDLATHALIHETLGVGDLAIIHPRVAHAFRVQQAGTAIEFAPQAFDPTDIHPECLI